MNAFLQRVALLRAEEQAEAEGQRWRAESQEREKSLRRCTRCGKGVTHPTNAQCADCNQKERDFKPRPKRLRPGRRPSPMRDAAVAYMAGRHLGVTVRELADVLESSALATSQLLCRMVASGRARRVEQGRYALVRP